MKGYIIGLLEILFFLMGSFSIRNCFTQLQSINKATYYWVMMTVLTGFWEIAFLCNYNNVSNMAQDLINTNQHVWTKSDYDISYILPWKLSQIFYSEYGAWADREYMSHTDDWSRIIEASHCSQCAFFALFAILFKIWGNHNNYLIALSAAMGTQFMNSFLYMFAYFIQERNRESPNYNNITFPAGEFLEKRLFMWVNIFWLIMPFFTIGYYLLSNLIKSKKIMNYLLEDYKEEIKKLPDDVLLF